MWIRTKILLLIFLVSFEQISLGQVDLPFFIGEAKKNSPLTNDNLNLSKANKLEVERLRAFYTKPQVGITASYYFSPIINLDNNQTKFQANSDGNATNYLGYDIAASNGGQYQALLNVTQPLFNSQKLKIADEAVNVASRINENNAAINGHDIEKIVTDQYILCIQDIKQNDYVNYMLGILSEQKEIVKKLVESSIYKQSDLSLLNIEYQNFLVLQSTNRSNYRRDLMNLNVLCGITDTTLIQLKDLDLKVSVDAPNSLFAEKYKLDSLNLIASKNIFELKYRPQLNLISNAGLNAVYAPTIPNRFGVTAGFSFTYNFLDGKQKYINRDKTDILLKSVSFYKENFFNQNNLRKINLLNEINSYTDRINLTEKQLSEYQTLLSLYKKEILTGQLSIINYVTVLKNTALIQRDYAVLNSQRQSLINAYNYWNW